MYIQRYIKDSVINSIQTFPVICIIGPRQSGKTTLIKNIIKDIKKKVTYLDLELYSDIVKLKDPEIFLQHRNDECVIIDEVQRKAELFPLIRALVDQKRVPGRFIILGSADPALMKYSSESLAGRIIYKQLQPFNLIEISEKSDIVKHWIRGGFPQSILSKNDNLSALWLDSFISTYIERDLPALGLDTSPSLMRRLWEMLAHFHGGILNMTSFANALDISVPTVSKYLNFLEGAFIINRLYPYYANIGKRLVKSPKIYLRDSGILHRLLNISSYNELQGYVQIGNSWEGYAIEQIKQLIGSNITLNFYRTQDASEVDLVLSQGINPVSCIEIKYSSAPYLTKGNSIAINDLNTENNFIITPHSDDYPVNKNVTVCNLKTFLKKYLPKIK
jgi:hypothetical protein